MISDSQPEPPTRSQISENAVNPAHEARLLCRYNLTSSTVGLAPGYLQANLVVLPAAYADDFRALCARNPVPCPILGETPAGNPHTVLPAGCVRTKDFDIRTDLPGYRVMRDGKLETARKDILDVWTDDHVGFLIGCSLSFEDALIRNGLPVCHQLAGKVPAMYETNIPLLPAGIFHGSNLIVSMRTYAPDQVERVRDITRPFLPTHGEPIAWGWDGASKIGIKDVYEPDLGDKQTFNEGEIPVFWACGVTPQKAVEAALPRIQGVVMFHEPGYVCITDWTEQDLPKLSKNLSSAYTDTNVPRPHSWMMQ